MIKFLSLYQCSSLRHQTLTSASARKYDLCFSHVNFCSKLWKWDSNTQNFLHIFL